MSHTEGMLEVVTDCPGECCWHIQRVGNNDKFNRITSVEMSEKIARRLVACWNACDGVETSSLEMGLKGHPQPIRNLARVNQNLMEERDALVAWLRVCDDLLKEYAPKYDGCSTEKKVFEILSKYQEAS